MTKIEKPFITVTNEYVFVQFSGIMQIGRGFFSETQWHREIEQAEISLVHLSGIGFDFSEFIYGQTQFYWIDMHL